MVLTDRSANGRSWSSSRTAVTIASRCRSPRLRRTCCGAGWAVIALDLRIHGAPEQNLTCVKSAIQDGDSEGQRPQSFASGECMATISTKDYLLAQAKRRLKPTAVTIP